MSRHTYHPGEIYGLNRPGNIHHAPHVTVHPSA